MVIKINGIKMSKQDNNNEGDLEGSVITKSKPKTKKPSMYKVLMINDDYTPMDFVVHVLQKFFKIPEPQDLTIMLQVHQKGFGVCGIFSFEVAESKVQQVVEYAKTHAHPLQCTIEKD